MSQRFSPYTTLRPDRSLDDYLSRSQALSHSAATLNSCVGKPLTYAPSEPILLTKRGVLLYQEILWNIKEILGILSFHIPRPKESIVEAFMRPPPLGRVNPDVLSRAISSPGHCCGV